MHSKHIVASMLLIAVAAYACSPSTPGTTSQDPSQLGSRQLEVRTLDVPYDVAYRAATQAFFSLGYSIDHSDKTSGILTGSRMTGVKEAKEDQQKRQALSTMGYIPYLGGLGALGALAPAKEAHGHQITMFLQTAGEKQTQIRFKMQQDGEPVWDQQAIDRLWVTTQREAMLEEGSTP